jgi:hypothetical protein
VTAAALVADALSVLAIVRTVSIRTDLVAAALTSLMPTFRLRHFDLLSTFVLHISGRLAQNVR